MKIFRVSRLALLFVIILFINSNIYSQWQSDSKYGFKINVPSSWSKTSYIDGTDKVYDYMSPDENAAMQIRVFKAGQGFTTALLAQVYEENMLPAGAQKLSLDEHTTTNGIPCKKGVYLLDYNGVEVGLSAIYIVQKGNGYVVTALIPASMIQQKGDELAKVMKSFTIDGFAPKTQTSATKTGGISGMMGKRNTQQSNNSSNVKVAAGRYNFISRSDGKVFVKYHYMFIESDGNFYEEYQRTNAGNYISKTHGMWSVNGNKFIVKHNNSSVVDTYTIRGNELLWETDTGVVSIFRKQ